jgi:hypothetical protein
MLYIDSARSLAKMDDQLKAHTTKEGKRAAAATRHKKTLG